MVFVMRCHLANSNIIKEKRHQNNVCLNNKRLVSTQIDGVKTNFLIYCLLWPCSLAGWVYGFVGFLCTGAPEGSTGSGSDFKASQKTGPRLKVSSNRLGEAGNNFPIYVYFCGDFILEL